MERRATRRALASVNVSPTRAWRAAAEVVAAVRETVGWDISLCTDHYGHGI